jgi:GTPase SAR1 family protein
MPIVAAAKTKRRKKQLQFLVLGAAGAGKTSLLRRFFHGQFTYKRAPTVGADFYVGRVPNTTMSSNNSNNSSSNNNSSSSSSTNTTTSTRNGRKATAESDDYLVQIWDTPGKENFAMQRQVQAALQDSFFDNADGIMLVYDMTSSTSFTRLLRWYADLLELFQRQNAAGSGQKPKPILLVANKLDLFEQAMNPRHRPRTRVSQRDVLGLRKDFYGNDFQYEYSVSNNPNNTTTNHHQPQTSSSSATISSSNNGNNNNNNNKTGTKPRHNGEISSQYFLANRDNWTSDSNYLESLITAEDGSHPDREMVLLWCLRNHVKLYEVSAATGDGVAAAFAALVALAAEQSNDDDDNDDDEVRGLNHRRPFQQNKELDLRDHYQPEQESVMSCCPPLFRNCCPK